MVATLTTQPPETKTAQENLKPATLGDSLTLRSGTVLRNRICKASMNEALATADGLNATMLSISV